MPPKKTDTKPPDFSSYPQSTPIQEAVLNHRFELWDKAAKKSDRWWMLTLMVLIIGYMGYQQWQAEKREITLRSEIMEVRTTHVAYITSKSEAMQTALINNTRVLELTTQALNRIERSTQN